MATGLRWTEEQLQAVRGRMQQVAPVLGAQLQATTSRRADGAPSGTHTPRAKYGNTKTEREGIRYDSAKESRVLADLETLERAGHIRDLRRQVKFAIVIDGIHVCDYVADAVYMEGARRVVVDVKSEATRKLPVYRLKRKLMAAVLGIEVEER